VPYRGSTGLLQDLIGGRLEAGVLTLGDLLQQERAGQLRLLASTGPVRSRFAPQLATFEEQKVSGLTMRDWMAVVIVGNPTAEVVSRVGAQVRAATASEAYVKALGASLLEAASSSSEELQALILADLNRWGPIVERSGFVADL
jgi:tripartite-type tricarboxylate transporter receptor subunit TctC